MQKDTIFALSTPQGVGGVAVIRISGPQAQAALQALFQPAGTSPMEPRKLIYGRFVFDGTQIDDGMAVLFCAPELCIRDRHSWIAPLSFAKDPAEHGAHQCSGQRCQQHDPSNAGWVCTARRCSQGDDGGGNQLHAGSIEHD